MPSERRASMCSDPSLLHKICSHKNDKVREEGCSSDKIGSFILHYGKNEIGYVVYNIILYMVLQYIDDKCECVDML